MDFGETTPTSSTLHMKISKNKKQTQNKPQNKHKFSLLNKDLPKSEKQ